MLGEFMGALWKTNSDFVNYLLKAERTDRENGLRSDLSRFFFLQGVQVFVFGSYLRRKHFNDLDILLIHNNADVPEIEPIERQLQELAIKHSTTLDLTVCSDIEYPALRLDYDNLTQVFP